LSLEAIEALRPLVAKVRRRDRSLADQLVRAARATNGLKQPVHAAASDSR
jgi:hypothetical protein